ncbi:helix-turn-helix domain-containing protein [Streptomyces yangpuensis]|uniref:helix-turn-helix domain-containing protein n=1 Tax=Streptomyces yangpuensis TaxID=1648182 RepID=UPI00365239D2
MHTNTVVRRPDRIGQLLGRDGQTPEGVLEIQLALPVPCRRRFMPPGPARTTGDGHACA